MRDVFGLLEGRHFLLIRYYQYNNIHKQGVFVFIG